MKIDAGATEAPLGVFEKDRKASKTVMVQIIDHGLRENLPGPQGDFESFYGFNQLFLNRIIWCGAVDRLNPIVDLGSKLLFLNFQYSGGGAFAVINQIINESHGPVTYFESLVSLILPESGGDVQYRVCKDLLEIEVSFKVEVYIFCFYLKPPFAFMMINYMSSNAYDIKPFLSLPPLY